MSRLGDSFESCRQRKRTAFIPFLTAGDPDLTRGAALLHSLVAGGADAIWLGVPFSDPIADGPLLQRSARRALDSGGSLSSVLQLVARHRAELGVPVVLTTYYNPVHLRGVERFAEQAASSGVDAVLCVDLPPEESERDLAPALRQQGVDPVYPVTPGTRKRRVRRIGEASGGCVLCVARGALGGERRRLPRYLLRQTKRLGRRLDLPLAGDFGVSTPEQVSQVARVADGVVVALTGEVERHLESSDLPRRIEAKTRELRGGAD